MTDFAATKALFHLPKGIVYLDGNSLGPLPLGTPDRVAQTLQAEWGEMLIGGWNRAGWMTQPMELGDRVGRLIGAEPGHVTLGDTLSIKVFQALAAALAMTDRKVILSDSGNFPSDLYIAEGLIGTLKQGHSLRLVDPESVADAITDEVGVLLLTEVDYRTGRLHDMAALTARAHAAGVLCIWDLAHSAGALPVDVEGCGVDFAVGCTYKYLNGGPGAPAFIYVAPRHAANAQPALSGWLGHDAPFAFEPSYRPGEGIARMRVGTPPVLQMAALEASMDIWDTVDLQALRRASIGLTERFIRGVEAKCPELTLASPRDAARRGSQVSFRHVEGYA
ncbi:MAG: kynureninase, partial [Paracoccaceae bacterium]